MDPEAALLCTGPVNLWLRTRRRRFYFSWHSLIQRLRGPTVLNSPVRTDSGRNRQVNATAPCGVQDVSSFFLAVSRELSANLVEGHSPSAESVCRNTMLKGGTRLSEASQGLCKGTVGVLRLNSWRYWIRLADRALDGSSHWWSTTFLSAVDCRGERPWKPKGPRIWRVDGLIGRRTTSYVTVRQPPGRQHYQQAAS